MIYLVITLFLMLLLSFFLNKEDFFSPSVLFSFSFFFSSCWALAFSRNWSLDLSVNTYLIIVFGVFEFIIIGSYISFLNRYRLNTQVIETKSNYLIWNKFKNWKLRAIIFLQIIAIFYSIWAIKKATGIGNLSDAIYSYRVANTFMDTEDTIHLPILASILWYFSYSSGFYFSFLLIKKHMLERKFDVYMIVIVMLSFITSMLKGDRTRAFILVIAIFTYHYCLKKKQSNWSSKGNSKFFIYGIILLSIFIFSFKYLANILGRNIDGNLIDYLSVYVGAEIKNLDTFVRSGAFPVHPGYIQSQTFIGIIGLISKILHFDVPQYRLNLPFQSVNGYGLGNVFTTFYAWLYDFGYIGVFFLTLIMAIITQLVYEHFKYNNSAKYVTLDILIYGYFSNTIILSFFSDKFYEEIFSSQFIYMLLTWIFLNWFIFKKNKPISY